MSVTGLQETSLRPGRFDRKRLAWAFAISLMVHGVGYGGYQFTRLVLPDLLQRVKFLAALAEELRPKKPVPPPQPTETPLVFVEVNPAVATPEPPKDAKYYSSQNSKAADIDSKLDTDTPKLTGKQQHVVKTEEAPRKFEDKLHPSAPPAKETETAQVAKPKPKPIGDLAMAPKPDITLHPENNVPTENNGTAEQTRPRTLTEARMRQQSNLMPGQQMKQEGGVRHHLAHASLDTKATPFGAYDEAFIEAVQQHWYDLLDSMNFSYDRHGYVVLQFHLNYDGTITDMSVLEDTVDPSADGILGFVCQRAVNEPAPYERWPREMRLQTDRNYRELKFTFYYD